MSRRWLAGVALVMGLALVAAGVVLAQVLDYAALTRESVGELSQLAALQMDAGTLDSVAFGAAADGHGVLASAGGDGQVRLVDVATGDVTTTLDAHADGVTRVVFSPDGTRLVSGGRDERVAVWDVASGGLEYTVRPHEDMVTALAVSADGRLLASGGVDGGVVLYEMATGAELARLQNYGGAVRDIAFSPDRGLMAAASEDGSIWLWGLTGEPYVSVLVGHTGPVTAATFSPDGGRLLSAGWDGTLRLWDVAAEREVMNITAADAPMVDVTYDAAGMLFAAAGLDGWLRVWRSDTSTGVPMVAKRGFGSPLSAVAFNPAGTLLATAGTDGVLGLWASMAPAAAPRPSPTVSVPAQPTPRPTRVPSTDAPPTAIPPTDAAPLPRATRTPLPQVRATAAPQLVGPSIYMPSVNTVSGIRVFPLVPPSWEIDPWEPLVGQFQGTGWLTDNSNIVLGGHSRLPDGRPGVFAGLYGLNVGDRVILQTGTGERREFRVDEIFSVPYTDVSVVMPNGETQLTLITCDVPSFDAGQQIYWERLVVIARPVPA